MREPPLFHLLMQSGFYGTHGWPRMRAAGRGQRQTGILHGQKVAVLPGTGRTGPVQVLFHRPS